MIKRFKLSKRCMYYVKEKEFRSRWQEQIYRWKVSLNGWKLEEIKDEN